MRRCIPPPEPQHARRYKLVSPAGLGAEKKLRALLAACPEWNDAQARESLVLSVLAEEARTGASSGVPEVLRGKTSAAMRKQHMLHLAHYWLYRCVSTHSLHACGASAGRPVTQ
jgi:hypothetical protein